MNKRSKKKEGAAIGPLLFFLRIISVLIPLFLFPLDSGAQLLLDRWMITNLKFTDVLDPVFDVENDTAYFFDFDYNHYSYSNDTLRIFTYPLASEKDSSVIKIAIDNFPVLISQSDAKDLCVSGENLILLFPGALLVYDLRNELLRYILPLGPSFNRIVESEDEHLIYLAVNYNSYKSRYPKAMASAFNPFTGQFIKDGNAFPDYDGIGFTHLRGNQWFGSMGRQLAFINPLNGQLSLYDTSGTLLRSCSAFANPDSSLLIALHDSLLKRYDRDPKNLIPELLELDNNFMRAERIIGINDSAFLLFLIPKNNHGRRAREVRKYVVQNDGICREELRFEDKEPGAMSKVGADNFSIFSFFSGEVKNEGGRLYRILSDIPEKYLGMNYGKVKLKRSTYMLRHLPVYHLLEFTMERK